MSTQVAAKPLKIGPRRGSGIVYPKGCEEFFGVSPVTRWRWERLGKLPPRDAFVGGRAAGWKPETLERAMNGAAA
jgi:hypothetical protein